jgi:uncharacterized membrane protein
MTETDTIDTPPAANPNGKAPAGWGWGMRLVLVASLGLNLVVVGLVAGAVINHIGRDGPPIVRDLGFGPYSEALSRDDRIALMRSFARESGGFRAMRREAQAAFGDLLVQLRAEPFDPAAFEALMQKQEARAAARLVLGQRLLIERIEGMSAAERQAFAERLQEALTRHDRERPPLPPDAPAEN